MTNEFIQKLQQIEEKLNHVSNQMDDLREAIKSNTEDNSYEHPWYKYKKELIDSTIKTSK